MTIFNYFEYSWFGIAIFLFLMWFLQIIIMYGKNHFGDYDPGLLEARERIVKYSECGCETDGVIFLEDNKLSVMVYLEWAESVGVFGDKTKCWYCYNKI